MAVEEGAIKRVLASLLGIATPRGAVALDESVVDASLMTCIEACSTCDLACQVCIEGAAEVDPAQYSEGSTMRDLMRTASDAQWSCRSAISAMIRGGEAAAVGVTASCAYCADACDAAVTECRKYSMSWAAMCATACEEAAKACRAVVVAGAGGEPPTEAEVAAAAQAAAAIANDPNKQTPAAPRAACGCTNTDEAGTAKEDTMAVKTETKDLVGRLLACAGSPFSEGDRGHLEGLSESALQELEKRLAPAATAATPAAPAVQATPAAAAAPVVPVAQPAAAAKAPVTEAEWFAAAPQHVRDTFERIKAQEAEERTALVASIVGAKSAVPKEQLDKMDTSVLRALAKDLRVASGRATFAERGMPFVDEGSDELDAYPPPPNPWGSLPQGRTTNNGAAPGAKTTEQ